MPDYTPTPNERRMIEWLRKRAEAWKTAGNNPIAALALISEARAIEQGRHHDPE